MKFTEASTAVGKLPLLNDHYVAIPYDCSALTAVNGVIPAGTIVPSNDDKAIGVLLADVAVNDNPNGTIIIHGFIAKSKLPTAPAEAAIAALGQIYFA